MKFAVKFISVITAIILSAVCFSCKSNGTALDLYYFSSPVHIQTQGKTLLEEDIQHVKDLLQSIQDDFDLSNDNSTPSILNDNSANQAVTLSDNAFKIFSAAKDCYDFTDGKFTPAIYPLIKLWHFTTDYPIADFTPPTNTEITAIIKSGITDFDKVILSKEEKTALKTDDNLSVDFGGIVKGYAADIVGKYLVSKGYEKGYLSIGSSSLYILECENLTVRHPRPTDDLGSILKINLKDTKNLSVSTSGDYERYYIHNEKTYSHLINPQSGYPAETGVISATIIGAEGAFSDAVTTALCICSHQSGNDSELISLIKKIIAKYKDASVYVVFLSGESKEIITNKTQDKDFTLLDDTYTVVNV